MTHLTPKKTNAKWHKFHVNFLSPKSFLCLARFALAARSGIMGPLEEEGYN